jgi:hypothetical protein
MRGVVEKSGMKPDWDFWTPNWGFKLNRDRNENPFYSQLHLREADPGAYHGWK